MEKIVAVLLLAIFSTGSCVYECDTGEVRLVNGTGGATNIGRVEFCRNGVWGTVSDYEFDMNDAKVVCRKLGFNPNGNGLLYSGGATYGQGTGQVFIGYLHCEGTEDQVLDCKYENNWIGNDHSHDVGVTCPATCTQDSLRLTGGFVSTEGTLEVCDDGAWNSICADEFQRQDGFVACRELGYPATATQVITSFRFNNGHGSPTWTKFQCVGNESSLSSCRYISDICEAFNPTTATFAIVGLKCEGEVVPPNGCTEGAIRLNGPNGANTEEGRIELCSNGAWGTVGSDDFGYKDGRAACRQLQYGSPGVRVYPASYFGDGSGPILMNDMACLGAETNLYQCQRGFNTSYAESHSNDATVKCWGKVNDVCTDYNVRFSNGSNNYGRLETCRFQEWGSICDEGWDRNDARTICRQRGFSSPYASFYTNSAFGDGDLIPVVLTDIGCTASDNTLSTCSRNDQIETNCNFRHTAGVRCFDSGDCTDGTIRLWGGNSDREGEVQICRNGVWGYICSNNWKYQNAKVICQQLQFSGNWTGYSSTGLFGGTQDTAPLVYDQVDCIGTESTLSSCTLSDYGTLNPTCTAVAGLKCAETGTCIEWAVRVADGLVLGDGFVEICRNNVWTTVDSSQWDYSEAMVTCRNQGYNDTWAVAVTSSQLGTDNRRIVHKDFQCVGQENSLQSCSSSSYAINEPMEDWYDHNQAGVSCRMRNRADNCTVQGAVRFTDGASSREGRLEVCMDGYWGSVCGFGWSLANSLVACRNAGYETLRPVISQGAYSGQGQGPVNLAYVSCLGNEANLIECISTSGIGVANCYHGNDVGLVCSEIPASYYNVTMTTSPSPDDVPVGSQVTLTCNSSPTPPAGVTYEWRADNAEDPLWQSDTLSQDARVTISHRHPKISHYYCAMKWGIEVLGIGSIKLTVKNTLVPTQSTFSGNVGGSVTLSVTQTATWGLNYIRDLQWYFHGIPVQAIHDYYSVSTDGLSLTLNNLSEIYSGEYSVQYDGLSVYQHSLTCEQQILELLREYPLFSPAVMKLEVGTIRVPDRPQDLPDSILFPDTLFTPYKKGTQYLALATHTLIPSTLFLSLNWHEFSLASFSSGNASSLYVPSGLLSPLTNPHYTLDFIWPTVLQTGFYETQLTIQPLDMLNSIGCSAVNGYGYADFVNTQLSFTNDIVLGSAKQAIGYYETPSAQLTASTTGFTYDNNATITCSSQGGYPLYYNVTIVKNGESVANMLGSSQLVYSTRDDETGRKYGHYWCVVNNLFDTDSTAVLLREQASLKLSLDADNCNLWTNDNKNVFWNPIMSLLQDACNCSLSGSTLIIDSVVCTTNIEAATSEVNVTFTLLYSTSDGSRISSTVFEDLSNTFNMGNNLSLTVSSQTLDIKWPRDMPGRKITLPDEALLAILFVAGFIASTLIFITVIIIAFFVIKKRKKMGAKKTAPPVAFHNQQVSMVQNTADVGEEEEEEWELPGEDSKYIT